jgi:predicted RNase H-like HicB family nuclease
MQYQVFVQSQGGNGFVAAVLGVPDCIAAGDTEDEAVARAKDALAARLAQGRVVTIEVAVPEEAEHPLLKHAGRFKDDPTFDDFLAEVERGRRESDVTEPE